MGERATVFNVAQLGVETTPGTAVTVTKQLASIDIQPGIKFNGTAFRPMGQKFATMVQPGREWVEAKVKGNPTFGELPYILSSLFKKATPTVDGTLPRLWSYVITPSSEDTPQTYTIEQGSGVRVQRFPYGLINSGTLNFKRDGIDFDGVMIGQQLVDDSGFSSDALLTLTTGAAEITAGTFTLTIGAQTTDTIAYDATLDEIKAKVEALSSVGVGNVRVWCSNASIADLTAAGTVCRIELINAKGNQAITGSGTFTSLTPTGGITLAQTNAGSAVTTPETNPVPMPGSGITVLFADSWAGLDAATVKQKAITASLSIQDRWGQFWYLDASKTSFSTHIDKAPNATMKVLVEADAYGMALLTTMRAGSQKFLRVKVDGPTIETNKAHLAQFDMVGLIPPNGVSDYSDSDGIYAIEWTFQCAKDANGNTIAAKVRNTLTAL